MFVHAGHNPNRFSLLLLDEGEYYFEDYEAVYYPSSSSNLSADKSFTGRLKICSKSFFFAPENSRQPIYKFPFDNITGCGKWNGPQAEMFAKDKEIFVVRTERSILMKKNNQNHPYEFIDGKQEFRFSLEFEKLINFLPKIQNLLRISQLHYEESNQQLSRLIEIREESIQFNQTWLVSLSEKSQRQLTAIQLTPLVKNPGRVLLTDQRLYFQPLNNAGPRPVERYELNQIQRVLTRRHALRHIGLEIFLNNNQNLYLSFKSRDLRDDFYKALLSQPQVPSVPPNDLELMTYKWRNRTISNFDYLMYLNTMAHRSFNDLTQYPVFPWVIADYTSSKLDLTNPASFRDLSKPIGALNPERLAQFQRRFKDMAGIPDQTPFLYGTHYSAPGYVLYYLVRQAPEYMLRLQNGKFDAANRMFHSIADTWQGVLINSSDVKELIPEFYMQPGEFLQNTQGVNLGVKNNGEMLNDVKLPPWASSPQDFVTQCQLALESDYVSAHLHLWIDLIFGYAQRGQAAIDHNNVFYYITYEGAVDIEKVYDPRDKKSLEDQINEFGQTPHQLFTTPHPARLPSTIITNPATPISLSRSTDRLSTSSPLVASPLPSKLITPSSSSSSVTSSSSSIQQQQHVASSSSKISTPPTSRKGTEASASQLAVEDADDYIPEIEVLDFDALLNAPSPSSTTEDCIFWPSFSSMAIDYSYKLHRDRVSSVCLSKDAETLYSVASDGCLKVFDLRKKKQTRSVSISTMVLSTCKLTSNNDHILIGAWDNHMYLYSLDYGRVQEKVLAHDDAVSCLQLRGDKLVTGSWDSTVKLWQFSTSAITPLPAFERVMCDTEVKCIDLSYDGTICVCGSADGKILMCDARDPHTQRNTSFHYDAISSIAFTPDSRNIITGSADGSIKMIDTAKFTEVVSIQTKLSIRSVLTDGLSVLAGTESGTVQQWDLASSTQIASLVNTKVPELEITCMATSNSVLVTGGVDGSIGKWV